MKNIINAGLAIFASLAAYSSNSANAQQPFYQGKTLSVIVGLAPGGGSDIMARIFAKTFAKNISGSPSVIVQNMPGAAGVTAMNWMFLRAPKDGSTIIYDAWTPVETVVKSRHVRYDYSQMSFIGALRGGPYMMFARTDSVPGGIKDSVDFIKAPTVIYGGQQPSLILDMHGRLALDLLKIKYNYISGYKGAADIRLAIDRNEVNVTTHGMQGYRSGVEPTLVKAGKAVPLWYFQARDKNGKFVPSELAKDIPAFQDVFSKAGGVPNSLQWQALELLSDLHMSVTNFVWGPPGMDQSARAELQRALLSTMNDMEFVAEQMQLYGYAHQNVPAEDAQRILKIVSSVKPELSEFLKKFMNP
jgi:tripartite-type tricarboxylate transporter receptor subunit TctC